MWWITLKTMFTTYFSERFGFDADTFRGAGICTPEDPLWKTVTYFLPKQAAFFQGYTFKENGGLYNVGSYSNFT
jgi:hypothetical protein